MGQCFCRFLWFLSSRSTYQIKSHKIRVIPVIVFDLSQNRQSCGVFFVKIGFRSHIKLGVFGQNSIGTDSESFIDDIGFRRRNFWFCRLCACFSALLWFGVLQCKGFCFAQFLDRFFNYRFGWCGVGDFFGNRFFRCGLLHKLHHKKTSQYQHTYDNERNDHLVGLRLLWRGIHLRCEFLQVGCKRSRKCCKRGRSQRCFCRKQHNDFIQMRDDILS